MEFLDKRPGEMPGETVTQAEKKEVLQRAEEAFARQAT